MHSSSGGDKPDSNKSKGSLLNELEFLHKQLAVLKEADNKRKKAEKALHDREQFLQNVFNCIQDGISILDKDLNIIRVNHKMEEWHSRSMPLLGKKCYEAYRGKNEVCENCPSLKAMKTKTIQTNIVPFIRPDMTKRWVEIHSFPLIDNDDNVMGVIEHVRDITERMKVEEELKRIEWLLKKSVAHEVDNERSSKYEPPYGNLLELNTSRKILDSVGNEILSDIVCDFLDIMDTSSAVYEKNGDYAQGIFCSGWCRFLDKASWDLCETDDTARALDSGKWLCHESCWTYNAKVAIETGKPVDIECHGGIRLYGVPIRAGNEIIGAMNIGYGDPPKDPEKLEEIAKKYRVNPGELRKLANEYESRPKFIIDIARNRLQTSAKLIGEIYERKCAEKALEEAKAQSDLYVDLMSHDINNMNQIAMGFLELSLEIIDLEGKLERDNSFLIEKPLETLKNSSRLIGNVSKIKQIKTDKLSLERIDLDKILAEVKNDHLHVPGRDVNITYKPLKESYVYASELLKDIFNNLVGNAIKHADPDKPLAIDIILEKTVIEGDDYYRVIIDDNGPGIPEKQKNKIFLRGEKGQEMIGKGLGLYIVKTLVEGFNGKACVEDRVPGHPSKGSRFIVILPVTD